MHTSLFKVNFAQYYKKKDQSNRALALQDQSGVSSIVGSLVSTQTWQRRAGRSQLRMTL